MSPSHNIWENVCLFKYINLCSICTVYWIQNVMSYRVNVVYLFNRNAYEESNDLSVGRFQIYCYTIIMAFGRDRWESHNYVQKEYKINKYEAKNKYKENIECMMTMNCDEKKKNVGWQKGKKSGSFHRNVNKS